MIIKSKQILTENGFINGYLTIEDGIIVSITNNIGKDCLNVENAIDYGNLKVIPGLIDIHCHGYGGWSMTDPATVDTVKGFSKAMSSIAVTTVLPTGKLASFEAIADCMDSDYIGARIYGIHSEGPFWARGGENTVGEEWPLPDLEMTKEYIDKCKGKLVMMAIAPELPKAYDVIRYLHDNNIKVAAAHTEAYAKDIQNAMKEVGLDIVTHLCNGMRGIHHRDVGALGAYLLEDSLYYEIIADLNHICADMLKLMFKIQPYEKFIMISDSNYIAGFPPGRYERYDKIVKVDEHGLIKDMHGRICGSGKYMLYNMKQLVTHVDVTFEDASRMSSINPARFLGIDDKTGSITVGKWADIAVVDDNYTCHATYVGGKEVYNINTDKNVLNEETLKRRVED